MMTSESGEKSLQIPHNNEKGEDTVDDEVAPASESPFVFKVEPNDVLLGRGAPIINNEGNVRFRKVVADRKAQYTASCRHQLKSQIAHDVIEEIVVNRKGRFLRKVDDVSEIMALGNGTVPQGVTSVWVVASDDVILLKVKQALREHDDAISHLKNTTEGANKGSRTNKKRARESKLASKASKRNFLRGEEKGDPDETYQESHSASTSTLDAARNSPLLTDPNLSSLLKSSVKPVSLSNLDIAGEQHQEQQNSQQNSPIKQEGQQMQNREAVVQQQERSDMAQLYSLLPGLQESFDDGQQGNTLYQQMMMQQIQQQNRQQHEQQIKQLEQQEQQLLLSQIQQQRSNASQIGGAHRLPNNDYSMFLDSFNPIHSGSNQYEHSTMANPIIKGLTPELNKHMQELQMLEKQYLQSLALQQQQQQQIEQESNALASSLLNSDATMTKNSFIGRSTSPTRQSIHPGVQTSSGMYLHNIGVMPSQHNWPQQNNMSSTLKSQHSQQACQMQRQLLQQVAGLHTQQEKISSTLDASFMNEDPQLDAMLRELQDVNSNDPSHILHPNVANQQQASDFEFNNFLANPHSQMLPLQSLLDQRPFGDPVSNLQQNNSSTNNGPFHWSSQISNRLDLQAQHQLIQQEHLQRSQQLLLQSTTNLGHNMLDASAATGDGKTVKEGRTKVNNASWDAMIDGNETSNDTLESIIQSTNPFL